MIRIPSLISIIVLLCLQGFSQNNFTDWINQAMNSDTVEIDNSLIPNASFYSLLENSSLSVLRISNFYDQTFPKSISKIESLKSIELINSNFVDIKPLCLVLSKLDSLTVLRIKNGSIKSIPLQISKLKNLIELDLTDNFDLDYTKAGSYFSKMPKLQTLRLSVYDIQDLDFQLLNDNYLRDIHIRLDASSVCSDSCNQFIFETRLDGIRKNIILYKANDTSIYIEELYLRSLFPNLKKKEIKIATKTDEMNFSENDFGDDTELVIDEMSEVQDKTELAEPESDMEFGSFQVKSSPFKILSDAYLHYPTYYQMEQNYPVFDSLLFEERYKDLSYSNGYPIDYTLIQNSNARWLNNTFYLYKSRRKVKGLTSFSLNKQKKEWVYSSDGKLFYKNYPELRTFMKYKWVYTGDLEKKEFYRQFTSGKRWTDIRIYYQEKELNFLFELKTYDSVFQFEAIPVSTYSKVLGQQDKKLYNRLYLRYLKVLERRSTKFNNQIKQMKYAYNDAIKKSYMRAWSNFRRIYMSPEELKMSRKEWLEYFDKVIADEKEALMNADARMVYVHRLFESDGFKGDGIISVALQKAFVESELAKLASMVQVQTNNPVPSVFGVTNTNNPNLTSTLNFVGANIQMFSSSQNTGFQNIRIVNSDSFRLSIKEVMVVDFENKSYSDLKGSIGVNGSPFIINPSSKSVLIVQTRGNDFGICPYLIDASFPDALINNTFEVKIIESKLATAGQVYNTALMVYEQNK